MKVSIKSKLDFICDKIDFLHNHNLNVNHQEILQKIDVNEHEHEVYAKFITDYQLIKTNNPASNQFLAPPFNHWRIMLNSIIGGCIGLLHNSRIVIYTTLFAVAITTYDELRRAGINLPKITLFAILGGGVGQIMDHYLLQDTMKLFATFGCLSGGFIIFVKEFAFARSSHEAQKPVVENYATTLQRAFLVKRRRLINITMESLKKITRIPAELAYSPFWLPVGP